MEVHISWPNPIWALVHLTKPNLRTWYTEYQFTKM